MSTFGVFAMVFAIVGVSIIGYVLYKSHVLVPRNVLHKELLDKFKSYRSEDK